MHHRRYKHHHGMDYTLNLSQRCLIDVLVGVLPFRTFIRLNARSKAMLCSSNLARISVPDQKHRGDRSIYRTHLQVDTPVLYSLTVNRPLCGHQYQIREILSLKLMPASMRHIPIVFTRSVQSVSDNVVGLFPRF